MSTKSLNERLTIQFGESRRKVYNDFMEVVKAENIPKSTAGYLLLEKGILHKSNPPPLIKEVEKKVYVDRPVEKVVEKKVYVDRPKVKREHLTDRIVDITKPSEKPKGIQRTQQETATSTGSGWVWLLGGLIALCGWKIGSIYLAHKNGNNGARLVHKELV